MCQNYYSLANLLSLLEARFSPRKFRDLEVEVPVGEASPRESSLLEQGSRRPLLTSCASTVCESYFLSETKDSNVQ